MAETELNFHNILVINFGQMGDVILSLPALRAVRERFPAAKITLMIGKPAAGIVKLADVSDDQIVVDRVEMRDGNKLRSCLDIVRLIRKIRINKFDLIIDLHSLSETNLLGFVSGAKHRLYSNRENRSLDRLASFPIKPPKEDKSKHHTERYFDVLQPLGIAPFDGDFRIEIAADVKAEIEQRLADAGLAGKRLIGLSVGAGHPSRCWELDKFAELSRRLLVDKNTAVIVFLGPEEKPIAEKVRSTFPESVVVIDDLSIPQFMAALSMLDVAVCNDSGPAHIAGIVGAPIVLIMDERAPLTFLPLGRQITIINSAELDQISVDEVTMAAVNLLDQNTH